MPLLRGNVGRGETVVVGVGVRPCREELLQAVGAVLTVFCGLGYFITDAVQY